ncbi:glutathionylspermidine synthase family protein [Clostridium saccharobutylicum]|uniref:Glutathionylspermidine synthase n=1 Tax=Clostridium saccharobutylicum DSM 13864 TaxID=1345695 RepID=U5MVY2_CLOSA|nr:glutathionylspermidine synthase family protein [Clostridium saccharobutylicum]AGX44765.1 glutathionylspermidine synthase [Clostridium saccharobutylicum DSM 13864]MBC2411152.1 glutathionylspermidine synthase family protein [Clostridium saccharobutylicum]MBC2478848.1 glutathionylspermidine synthase family protein [Clostridium saccharobutylicum]NSB95714.1 glutathionylspermidine synthase [Clostridium saccharobutylicum]
MKKQFKYTEDVLFDNYMVSSFGEEYVHSQIPFYFDIDTYEDMVFYSEEINRISLKILKEISGNHKRALNYFDDFPLKDKIFNLKCPISPMFWTRYDTFRDVENNIYFAEFNYDKPCGQKEIALDGKMSFKGNLNLQFIDNIIKELLKICCSYINSDEKINVGFLIDPCHYEELHHSYYFKHILKNTNVNIVQVGPTNLSVKDGDVYGYSSIKLPIILRLFPTEFFYEITNIEDILECFDKGNVLLINDPRIVAIQAKGFFAYLWDLVKEDSPLLSEKDKLIIKKCIPITDILELRHYDECLKNKDKYVIKSSLGRYSQEVYIGKLYKNDEWNKKIEDIVNKSKIHIIQDLINIKQEYTYVPSSNDMNVPILAYGNFGVYLMNDKVQGFLVRWSKTFLTDDSYTWMSPLGTKDFPIFVERFDPKNRKEIWDDIVEKIEFEYDFTGSYSNINEYISLNSLIIKKNFYKEMLSISFKFCEILNKISPYIQKNMELFGPLLGIPKELYKLVSTFCTSNLCALGRIDIAVDNDGNLKIMEFNSETPAGLVEAIGVNSIVKDKLNIKYDNPNEKLRKNIKESFACILEEIKKKKKVENIAVVTTWYYEDIYTSNLIMEILKELREYNVILGNVYDLKVMNNKLYLYGQEIHALYRHYPLDWFYYEEEMQKLIELLSCEDYLINPGYTLITQSKSLFAVIHELINKQFFSKEEEEFVLKYIPYTCLEPDDKLSHDFVVKPYLSREGGGVQLSCNDIFENLDDDVIYQNRINIKPLYNKIYSTTKEFERYQFPVIGVYITGNKPAGIYTRMGDFVTDKNALYMPTYIV